MLREGLHTHCVHVGNVCVCLCVCVCVCQLGVHSGYVAKPFYCSIFVVGTWFRMHIPER